MKPFTTPKHRISQMLEKAQAPKANAVAAEVESIEEAARL